MYKATKAESRKKLFKKARNRVLKGSDKVYSMRSIEPPYNNPAEILPATIPDIPDSRLLSFIKILFLILPPQSFFLHKKSFRKRNEDQKRKDKGIINSRDFRGIFYNVESFQCPIFYTQNEIFYEIFYPPPF